MCEIKVTGSEYGSHWSLRNAAEHHEHDLFGLPFRRQASEQ
jgi:hypothetical protein